MKQKNKKTKLILISGGTASGKTTFAKAMLKKFQSEKIKAAILTIDEYYFEITHWKDKSVENVNWDNPSSIDWDYLYSDLEKILSRKKVIKHEFVYEQGVYNKNKKKIYNDIDVLILEGIFALHSGKIVEWASLKVYIDADHDIRLIRRIKRDRKLISTFEINKFFVKWLTELKPMHERWNEPQKKLSNVIVQNSTEISDFKNDDLESLIGLIVKN